MNKPIPKFLHEDLKKLIGKRNPTQDDVSKLLELVFTTKYRWTERVMQYQNVHYEAETHVSLEDMLEDSGELSDLIDAWQRGDVEECTAIIGNAVDVAEDDLHDNRWDHSDEVDRDYLDEEFEDTIDSDVDTFVTTRQQGTSWMGEKLRDYHIHEGQQHFFGWKNIVNWFANRRSTPMNTAAHVRYTRQDEETN
jgi:hypothetical protein